MSSPALERPTAGAPAPAAPRRRLLLASIERLLPRGLAALAMVAYALAMPPGLLGYYAWLVLVTTLLLAMTDEGARQAMLRHVGTPDEQAIFRRYTMVVAPLSTVILTLTVLALWRAGGDDRVLQLLLACPAPAFTAMATRWTLRLQCVGAWHTLVLVQSIAAVVAYGVALPLLAVGGSLAAPACAVVLIEAVALVLSARWGARVHPSARPAATDRPWRDFAPVTGVAVLGWLQTQLDRVGVGVVGGTAALAVYATAANVGRMPSEAVAAGVSNVVRTHAVDHAVGGTQLEREMVRRALRFGMLGALGFALALVALDLSGAERVLGEEWSDVLTIAALLSFAGISTVFVRSGTALLVGAGLAHRSVPARAVGVVATVAVVLAATHSLLLAALVYVLRETLVAVLLLRQVREWVDRRQFALWQLAAVIGATSVWLLDLI